MSLATSWALGTPLPLEVRPAEEGWHQNAVTTIVQSHDGYLWLGTYHGLVRFDGVRFVIFDSGNTPGLPNGLITCLYEDPEGVLWIGHETGHLTALRHGVFQPVSPGRGWPGGAVEALSTDQRGDLWLLNDLGLLFRLRDGKSAQCPGVVPSRKPQLTRSPSGQLWLVFNGQVATLDDGVIVPHQFDTPAGEEFYEKIALTRDGGLWVANAGRLRKWLNGRWQAELAGCPPEPGAVTTLLELRSGAVLVGTVKSGLFLLAPGSEPQRFDRSNGLSHHWIRALREDQEGNIWIGNGTGLDTLRTRKVRMLNPPDGWLGCGVQSLCVRPDGSAWIGTEGAGLYHFQHDTWTPYRESSGVSNAFIWSVLETAQGRLYAGTWGEGLLARQGERFSVPESLRAITAPVVSLYQGKRGELWIGTTLGLHRFEHNHLTWSAGKERLLLPDVRAITETPDGTLWFGMSGGGLGALKDGSIRQFRKGDGPSGEFVLCLFAEPDGTLWFGTSDNGLGRYKEGKFATISTAQGLPNRVISHLVDDQAGNLWLGSQQGILRASKAELNRCADGLVKTVAFLTFGKAEGLASLSCSGGFQPGACRTPDGRLWFPTAKGLAVLDPANVSTNLVPPPVVIEEVRVDGQSLPLQSWLCATGKGPVPHSPAAPTALRIPPGRQRFEFHYTGLSFVAPDKVRFRYRLEGLEQEWMEAGAKRFAQYSYLRPGAYTFHVLACNNDEVWNETGATLQFIVLAHFWQTWWFHALWLLTGAGAVGAAVLTLTRSRVRRKLEQLERQRALERERARIARDIHDDLGASLTRITLLSQSVRSELDSHPEAAADVDLIYTTARELTRAMDEIVWAVNPKHDTLDSLVTYLGRFAQSFLAPAAVRCRLEVPMYLPPWALTSEIRHNVFLAFKEALHNTVKHAQASEVHVALELLANGFVLLVADNGRGFDTDRLRSLAAVPVDGLRAAPGNGLLNMQKRLEEIGGRCTWETLPGQGTKVRLAITLAEAR